MGRGNPFRKNIEKTSRLAEECFRLAKALGYVQRVSGVVFITDKGEYFLSVSNREQKVLFAEDHSGVYPHLTGLVLTLARLRSEEAVLPMMNRPSFRPEAEKIGLMCGQVTFDLTRDWAHEFRNCQLVLRWSRKGKASTRVSLVYALR